MKKKLNLPFAILAALAFFQNAAFCAGKEKSEGPEETSKYSYEYREIAQKLKEPLPPFEKDGLIVFSAEAGPHFVGIAFDFENYQKIHPFHKRVILDEDGKRSRTWYFYILEEYPPQTKKILYRMIIDGLWTTDPMNEKQHYDVATGIRLSQYDVERKYEKATTVVKTESGANMAHFVYKGKSGQIVRLAGTFTKWDSWIYELKETSRGFYELELPLTEGVHYYAYYIGTKSFPDKTNHERAIKDGSVAVSKLVVE